MSRRRLLLLSGGSMVGQNVLATLSERRDRVHLTATSSIADEPALFAFDAVYLVPVTAADPATLERRVVEIVEQERGRRSPATPARVALEGFASRAADPRAVETLARDGCWRKEETSA